MITPETTPHSIPTNPATAPRNAFQLSQRWLALPSIELASLVREIVERVTVTSDRIDIHMSRAKVTAALGAQALGQRPGLALVAVSIEAKLRRAGKGKRIVIENGAEAEVNTGLAALISEAFVIRIQLLSGSDDSIEAMIERLGIARGRLSSLVRLSYIAPDIMRAVLEGRQPIELTPTRLLQTSKNLPHDWKEQRLFLSFTA